MKQEIYRVLKGYFGYDSFRTCQEDVITSILKGNDTMAIMPTGAGKSICYQIPGILSPGTTIVISPLISLMKDQVDHLEAIGVPATYLNSSLSSEAFRERLRGIYQNQYKIIYAAPERLETEGFLNAVAGLVNPCSQVIVDEAHCVSRWGHDFRPSYTRIRDFVERLPKRPTVAAFTATATESVKQDMEEVLGLIRPEKYSTGFDRPNLEFRVCLNVDKDRFVKDYVKSNSRESGIIYAATRKETERINQMLQKSGVQSGVYHAGLPDDERNQAQEDYLYDNITVMVATNAFGMGIDKSNVRYVIHYNMPKDMESYYQEAGRAGRDGLPSTCILLYAPGDTATQKYFIDEGELDKARKANEYKKLQYMENYCHTPTCLRSYMLAYFGEEYSQEKCDNCSVCNRDTETKDITLEAQMILSCVHRSGQRFGRSVIIDTLRGSKNKRVTGFKLDRLKTYGLMAKYPKKQLELWMNFLVAEGYLHKTEDQYPVLRLTQKSLPVLKNEAVVTMEVAKAPEEQAAPTGLFDELRQCRKELAVKMKVPPYVIFPDNTLKEMCKEMPRTLEDLTYIKGVGENRKNKYGQAFVDIIRKHTGESEAETTVSADVSKKRVADGPEPIFHPDPDPLFSPDPEPPFHPNPEPMFSSDPEPMFNPEPEPMFQKKKLGKPVGKMARGSGIKPAYERMIAVILVEEEWDGSIAYIRERVPDSVGDEVIQAVIDRLKQKLNGI